MPITIDQPAFSELLAVHGVRSFREAHRLCGVATQLLATMNRGDRGTDAARAALLALLNKVRRERGLKPLTDDDVLASIAVSFGRPKRDGRGRPCRTY